MSGAWWVDQGIMFTNTANKRAEEWNKYGFTTLITEGGKPTDLPVVSRPNVRLPESMKFARV